MSAKLGAKLQRVKDAARALYQDVGTKGVLSSLLSVYPSANFRLPTCSYQVKYVPNHTALFLIHLLWWRRGKKKNNMLRTTRTTQTPFAKELRLTRRAYT